MRFAKTHNFNHELQAKLAEYGQGLRDAQANSDNEAIVENFMGLESCYYDNTKISNSIFGKRSVGEKYFTPIAEQFDYRDDPFITDLLSTIVIATAAVSAVNSIRTAINNQKAVQAHNAELDKVNAQNNATMNDVHKVGDNITGQGDNYMEGMKAGINQDNLNIANASERGAMDATDWGFGDYYRSLDSANHEMYNGIYDSTTSQIDTISSQYVNGAISQVEALKQLAEVQTTTQSKLVEVINNYKDVCTEYAATHTQFDLHSLLGSFDYISSNPEAITKMAESGIYSIEEAAKLAGMSAAQATAFAGLDSDVLTTLIAAGSAASLVNRVTRTMSKNFNDGKYNSKFRSEHAREVDAMFEDYYGEEETNKKRK